LRGTAAKESSYCAEMGYEIRTLDNEKCDDIYWGSCAVCVIDGKEVEMTKLMNLSFTDSVCGDEFCVPGWENNESCSEDCEIEPEEPKPKFLVPILIFAGIIALILIAIVIKRIKE
jgi:putative hemolysin